MTDLSGRKHVESITTYGSESDTVTVSRAELRELIEAAENVCAVACIGNLDALRAALETLKGDK